MKHLKRLDDYEYEKISNDIKALLIEFDEAAEELYVEGCPFVMEILVLHNKKWMYELFHDFDWGISYEDFYVAYVRLVKESEEKIFKMINDEPSLYSKWKEYLLFVKVPEFAKNVDNYNL